MSFISTPWKIQHYLMSTLAKFRATLLHHVTADASRDMLHNYSRYSTLGFMR